MSDMFRLLAAGLTCFFLTKHSPVNIYKNVKVVNNKVVYFQVDFHDGKSTGRAPP